MISSPQPTIAHIARESGFSRSTVGHVLNRRADELRISAKTQQTIERVAKRVGYRPNPLARGLRGQSTNTIGLLWSLCGPHDSGEFVRLMAERARDHEYETYLIDTQSDPEIIVPALAGLARRGTDAVVLQTTASQVMSSKPMREALSQFRSVVIVTGDEGDVPFDTVRTNVDGALEQVLDHYAAGGRRSIAIAGAKVYPACKGCKMARLAAEAGFDVQWVECDTRKPLHVASRLVQAYEQGIKFDCVFCTTDESALASLTALTQRGVRVPEDVALVGSNDSDFAAYSPTPLASIKRRMPEIVQAIDKLLFERLTKPNRPRQTLSVSRQFVWRASAGGPTNS